MYEEEITPKIVNECLNEKSLEPLFQSLFSADKDEAKKMWNNTKMYGRFHILSNYDTMTPLCYLGSLSEYGYVNTAMDLLNMNPISAERGLRRNGVSCNGTWKSLNERKGKNILTYDDFGHLIADSYSYCHIVLVGAINMPKLWELLENGLDIEDSVTIPKGTKVLTFNDWQGGGGFFKCETIRDLNLKEANKRGETEYDRFMFRIDEGSGDYNYSTESVYGERLNENTLFI